MPASTPAQSTKERGRCGTCGHDWPLRKDGAVQAHHGYDERKRLPGGNCAGSGSAPKEEP